VGHDKRFVALVLCTACALMLSQGLIWLWAPVEASMGIVQKIFYLHLPLAWWGFVGFFLVFVCSIGYLGRRRDILDHLAGAAAEVGLLFASLVLLTGILWAKASWNVWWTWDPRLSTTLILWFIYSGYLVLRGASVTSSSRQKTVAAVLGVVAFLDVPLVFLSARWFRSIHPAVLASREGSLPFEMLVTLAASLIAWGGLFGLLLWLRFDQYRLEQSLRTAVWKSF
jgi:heme exporter protein C